MGEYFMRPLVAENITDSVYHHPAQDAVADDLMPTLTAWIEANAHASAPKTEGYAADPQAAIAECREETVIDIISWLSDIIHANIVILKDAP